MDLVFELNALKVDSFRKAIQKQTDILDALPKHDNVKEVAGLNGSREKYTLRSRIFEFEYMLKVRLSMSTYL